jgi:predicted DNA-binding ribbon-helix-helix protein
MRARRPGRRGIRVPICRAEPEFVGARICVCRSGVHSARAETAAARRLFGSMVRSRLVSRNFSIRRVQTSMRLQPEFWHALQEICQREAISLDELIALAVGVRPDGGRTSAVRVFVVSYFRDAVPSGIQAGEP